MYAHHTVREHTVQVATHTHLLERILHHHQLQYSHRQPHILVLKLLGVEDELVLAQMQEAINQKESIIHQWNPCKHMHMCSTHDAREILFLQYRTCTCMIPTTRTVHVPVFGNFMYKCTYNLHEHMILLYCIFTTRTVPYRCKLTFKRDEHRV